VIISFTSVLTELSAQTTITSAFPNFGGGNVNAFQLGGDAVLNGADLRLTRGDFDLYGTAYYKKKVALVDELSFSALFTFSMNGPVCGGADGIAFVLQQSSNLAGGTGEGLGYGGVSPSLAVEFDTFNNGGIEGSAPSDNHIGINLYGSTTSAAIVSPALDFNDGGVFFAWIDYDGLTDQLEVRLSATSTRPAAATLSYLVDIPAILSSDIFVGFTGATGDCYQNQFIHSFFFQQ